MTVLTASAKLYEWFTENDSFCLDYDFNKVFQENQDKKDRESACVVNALEQFDEMQFTSSAEVGGKKVWTLKKPLNAFPQTLDLTPDTCLQMSHVINGFCEYIQDDSSLCDPMNISEQNVVTLLTICATLIKDKSEENGNDDIGFLGEM
jgi:hypothetical protein